MDNLPLENLLRSIFRSDDPDDWKARNSWRRRALFWKMMAIALMHDNKSDEMKAIFSKAKHADMVRSPTEQEILWFLKTFNAIINRAGLRSQLILPPELSLK